MSAKDRVSGMPTFVAWLRNALRDPFTSDGDYFAHLDERIRSSAPVCGACSP